MDAVQDARLAPMGNHAGLHPKERTAAAISISDLAAPESEEAMDQLLGRDVDSPASETLHPDTRRWAPVVERVAADPCRPQARCGGSPVAPLEVGECTVFRHGPWRQAGPGSVTSRWGLPQSKTEPLSEPPVAEVVGTGARDAVPADLPYADRRTDTELGPDTSGHRSLAIGTADGRHRDDRI